MKISTKYKKNEINQYSLLTFGKFKTFQMLLQNNIAQIKRLPIEAAFLFMISLKSIV